MSAGRTSAITSSMPTSAAATARAVDSLSPVSSTGRRPRRSQLGDRRRARRLDRVGDDEDRRAPSPSQAAAIAVLPPSCALRARARARAELEPPLREERRPADDERVAVDDAFDAEALAVPERLDRRERAVALGGACDRAARSDARTRARRRRRAAAPRRASVPGAGDDVDERQLALGDRAGLVEDDRVDAARRLEHLRALDQDAELRAAAGADEQRRRRREAERARARDDQHGDRRRERERRARAAGASQ